MIHFSRFLGTVIMPTARPVAWGRDALFGLVNALPAARNHLSQAAIKPAPRYKRGFFLRGGNRANRSFAGLMLPQPEIGVDAKPPRLLDDILGAGFALLRLNSTESAPFAGLADLPIWSRPVTRLLAVGDEMRAALGIHEDLFLLVRPDRYIYAAFPPEQAASFATTWEQSLRGSQTI
jgi:3-(3-hydroxy-phenyl)propionate hydroxylase